MSLRDKEVQILSRMLTLSGSSETAEDFTDQWKVLVYDQDCRDIISPLMNIGALRQKGVTLHMLLHSDREAVPDAPVVYFVRPTEANVKRITEDCEKQLYRSVYINFVTRIERPLLEKFARDLVASNCVSSVSKIYDQYLDVVALEPSLFTLNIKDSFKAYNDSNLTEADIRSFISRVSTGLLSLVRVMGTLPVIRAPGGGAAAMLAQDLCDSLRENLSARGAAQALFADCLVSDRPRPLLLIFDRTTDMSPPLLHTSTYQALVDDLLEHKLNRVTVDISGGKDGGGGARKKTYDLNTQADPFYARFAGCPFPEAVEANEKELADVSSREAEIRSKPSSGAGVATFAFNELGTPGGAGALGGGDNGKDLTEAIESLPEILSKKANLEAHTNILQAVMKHIAAREVPTYFECEQAILTAGRVLDRVAVINLLKDGSKGKPQDKARLLILVFAISDASTLTKSIIDEYEAAFTAGCAACAEAPTPEAIDKMVKAAAFVRRLQSLQGPMSQRIGAGGASTQSNAMLSSLITSAQSAISKAASFFVKFAPVYVTRVVELLAEGKACAEDDMFCTLDPRLRAGDSVLELKGQKYSEVIVFVIGGGCYSEFYNLQELLKQKASGTALKSIVYGCSELLSGDDFLTQLESLATKS